MNRAIIGFSRPKRNTIISWLIERAEGTPYDHVYIRFYAPWLERWIVYQASALAVNFMGFERFSAKNDLIEEYLIEMTDDEYQRLWQFCIDEVGTPYGSKWLIGMAWVRLMRLWFGLTVHNPFPSGRKTFGCSKMGGYVLELLGKQYSDVELEDADPKWINQQVRSWDRAVRYFMGK